MARIRSIKPEFWSSPSVSGVDPWVRLLFVAMWNWADDTGRGTANPRELAGFAFPNDEDITSADVRRMLGGIRRAFGVVFYEVAGRPYYCIPSWDRHQRIDKRSGPRHPGPEDGIEWDPVGLQVVEQPTLAFPAGSVEPSAGPAEDPPRVRRELGAGTGEQGNRGTGEVENASRSPAANASGNVTDLTLNQRAVRLATFYYEGIGKMHEFKAVLGIVKAAIETARWSDADIQAALQLLIDEGQGLTKETLRRRLPGAARTETRAPSRAPVGASSSTGRFHQQ